MSSNFVNNKILPATKTVLTSEHNLQITTINDTFSH